MSDYLTNDQILYIVHGYEKRTITHNIFLINLIVAEQLSEREQIILRLRFKNGMLYREISKIFNFATSERPRQIIQKALRIIRHMNPHYKKEYLINQ